MHIYAPPESNWDPAPEPWAPCRTKFLVESGTVMVLRPDDTIEIELCTLKFQRDFSQPVGEVYDVQVKSSGHTGLILDTDDEDQQQQVVKSETKDLTLNSNQTLSTPDMQLDDSIAKMEAIMETPAASRHQYAAAAAVKTDTVLSCSGENISRVQDESQDNGEELSDTRVVAESFDDGTTSVDDGSAVETAQEPDNESFPSGLLADATAIISNFSAEAREIIPIRLDQTEEDSQISSVVCVGQSLPTPLESQEHTLLNRPPSTSIPASAPQLNGHKIEEVSDGIPLQDPSGAKLPSDPHQASERSSSKSRKRKRRQEEEMEVHTTKVDFEIQIPIPANEHHATAYKKAPNKRQNPVIKETVSSLKNSTRRLTSESPRNSNKPSPLVQSKPSSSSSGLNSNITPSSPTAATAALKILFSRSSTTQQTPKLLKFLTSKGISKAKSVKDCDVLCVSSGPPPEKNKQPSPRCALWKTNHH